MKYAPTESVAVVAFMVAVSLLVACAAPPSQQEHRPDSSITLETRVDDGVFPVAEGLRPQIEFWRRVYSEWSLRQVVLHDDVHVDLIYTVIELPGPIEVNRSYTASQRALVREYRKSLSASLQALERKLLSREALSKAEQALATHITLKANHKAIFGASERVRSQRGQRERFKRGLEISGRYDGIFREIFQAAGLPGDLAYLPHVESSFQAHARSSAGAVGMWQFTRPAARVYMRNHPALDERLDPVASARGAARYLRDAYDQLGDWALALTSYNHGIGGMRKAKDLFGNNFMGIVQYYDHRRFGFASRNFYAEFLAAREIARNPERFFSGGLVYDAPLDWDRIVLKQPVLSSEVARYYGVVHSDLVALNAAWTPAAVRDKVALPVDTEVWLPPGTLVSLSQSKSRKRETFVFTDGVFTDSEVLDVSRNGNRSLSE